MEGGIGAGGKEEVVEKGFRGGRNDRWDGHLAWCWIEAMMDFLGEGFGCVLGRTG